jgi:hypothetical protein
VGAYKRQGELDDFLVRMIESHEKGILASGGEVGGNGLRPAGRFDLANRFYGRTCDGRVRVGQ